MGKIRFALGHKVASHYNIYVPIEKKYFYGCLLMNIVIDQIKRENLGL